MYRHISSFYNQIFPKNQKLHDFILKYAHKDQKAIDLGTGTGRLIFDMDQKGISAFGIDLDDSMIDYAKLSYPSLNFMTLDMIGALEKKDTYHLITCVGNTLPHLDKNQLKIFFKLAKLRLDQDGVLIIQLLNYDWILRELPETLPIIQNEHFTFIRKYQYMDGYIKFITEFHTEEGVDFDTNIIYPYRIRDLITEFDSNTFSYEIYNEKLEFIKDQNHTHYTILLRHQKNES
jgi:glycine/sarcosine N-methyltransferase